MAAPAGDGVLFADGGLVSPVPASVVPTPAGSTPAAARYGSETSGLLPLGAVWRYTKLADCFGHAAVPPRSR